MNEHMNDKFEDGVLRIDGCMKRYETHGEEIMTKAENFGSVSVNVDERDINRWHSVLHVIKDINEVPRLMKTKEERLAELNAILGDEL